MTSTFAGVQINPKVAERLNELMRPEESVSPIQVAHAILNTIADLGSHAERGAALGYVFQNFQFAGCTGELTPASAYTKTETIVGSPSGLLAALGPLVANTHARDQWNLLIARIKAEQPSAAAVGGMIWSFLSELESPMTRTTLFSMFLTMPTLLGYTPHIAAEKRAQGIPNEEFQALLWQHRDAARALFSILKSDRYSEKSEEGNAVLRVLGSIEDPRAREAVLGYALSAWENAAQCDVALPAVLGLVLAKLVR